MALAKVQVTQRVQRLKGLAKAFSVVTDGAVLQLQSLHLRK